VRLVDARLGLLQIAVVVLGDRQRLFERHHALRPGCRSHRQDRQRYDDA
jgi:hypothetical protein